MDSVTASPALWNAFTFPFFRGIHFAFTFRLALFNLPYDHIELNFTIGSIWAWYSKSVILVGARSKSTNSSRLAQLQLGALQIFGEGTVASLSSVLHSMFWMRLSTHRSATYRCMCFSRY